MLECALELDLEECREEDLEFELEFDCDDFLLSSLSLAGREELFPEAEFDLELDFFLDSESEFDLELDLDFFLDSASEFDPEFDLDFSLGEGDLSTFFSLSELCEELFLSSLSSFEFPSSIASLARILCLAFIVSSSEPDAESELEPEPDPELEREDDEREDELELRAEPDAEPDLELKDDAEDDLFGGLLSLLSISSVSL